MKTNSDSEYGFRSRSDPCETRFVGTHQHVTAQRNVWRTAAQRNPGKKRVLT